MAFHKTFPVIALLAGAVSLGATSPARASLELTLESGGTTVSVPGNGTGSILFGSLVGSSNPFPGTFSISLLSATSNSAVNGPGVISELDISSFTVTNLTGTQQTLVISASDVGFSPDSSSRPLTVFNTASGTFGGLTSGSIAFQTYAYDGSAYFQTSGSGVVATDPVTLTPNSSGSTTTAFFTPTNGPADQFSLTNVATITLDPYASVSGFTGVSLAHAPEPGTLALVISGSIALGIGHQVRRRRITG